MKHLLTLTALFISSLAMGQDHPEFPFPYNPDGNADGYIGLNDMLDLLSAYGQQYPESFYSDSSAAILNLGLMPPHVCIREARLAGSGWRVMTYDDYWNHFDLLSEVGQQWFDNEESPSSFPFFYKKDGGYDEGALRYDRITSTVIGNQVGSQGFPFDVYTALGIANSSSSNLTHYSKYCLLVTEVYPEIKYHIVNGYREAVQAEVADSLSNGWRLNGGISAYSNANFQQAIWKYAE